MAFELTDSEQLLKTRLTLNTCRSSKRLRAAIDAANALFAEARENLSDCLEDHENDIARMEEFAHEVAASRRVKFQQHNPEWQQTLQATFVAAWIDTFARYQPAPISLPEVPADFVVPASKAVEAFQALANSPIPAT